MNKNSRTLNSIKNSLSSLICNIIAVLVGFISQAAFIRILNAEYLGLNGLFTNILTMLSLFELGVGNAIVFYMYKPLANKDYDKIKALMNFYKKSYFIISIVVFSVGIILLPFIKFFVGEVTVNINIYIIYILFLVSTVVSYIMVYKRNMIYADQKNYYINIIHCGYLIVLNVSQLLVLYFTHNYYFYLSMKIICQIIENVIITLLSNRLYPFLNDKSIQKLDKTTEKNIFNKVKSLIFHKIGFIIVNGTDNIIISKYFGILVVGMYSNYYLITNSVYTMFSQAITALTSSVGNLLINANNNKKFAVFSKIRYINFMISNFCATSILALIQPFISVWVGKKYLLGNVVVYVIVFNCFQKLQRCCYMTFKDSAGIWEEDKYVPLIESALNIIFSIIFLKLFELPGVFLGTIISGLVLWCFSYPKFVYKKIFGRKYIYYIKETLLYIIVFIINSCITLVLLKMININNIYLNLITNFFINLFTNVIILVVIFRKTDEFKYFVNLFQKVISRRKKTAKSCNSDNILSQNSSESDESTNIIPDDVIDTPILDKDLIPEEVYRDRESLSRAIRNDSSYIRYIDFNYRYDFDIVDLILEETKIYSYVFHNEDYLRNNKYPTILSNNHTFVKYVIDKDFNNIFYVDTRCMSDEEVRGLINYTFRKVYYLREDNRGINFNINKFSYSDIMNDSYFQECLKYLR